MLHQNFPGQFLHLAPALVEREHEVHALVLRKEVPAEWSGVHLHSYAPARGNAKGIHPWLLDLESKTIRGDAVFRKCLQMRDDGFTPDIVLAHPGWGESLFVKDVWPDAKLGLYCELHYSETGNDVNFDPEFINSDPGNVCRLRLKNVNNQLHFDIADAAVSPTEFQANTFPESFRSKISVIHDGIDTQRIAPNLNVTYEVNSELTLRQSDEVITFVNRNLEPYRGYHVFMRALPQILKSRPNAQVVIVGADGVSYGKRAPDGKTWKQIFLDEVHGQIAPDDWERVHFVGTLSRFQFTQVLQISSVHVYLTYPFVLSWSLLEAMSVECAIVASDTAPVQEFIEHDKTGVLTPFFDQQQLVDNISLLLDNPEKRAAMGKAAREEILRKYDLKTVCLPNMLDWVEALGRVSRDH